MLCHLLMYSQVLNVHSCILFDFEYFVLEVELVDVCVHLAGVLITF